MHRRVDFFGISGMDVTNDVFIHIFSVSLDGGAF
jgi:hypothetical protein